MSSRYTTRRKTKQTEPITKKGSQPKKSKISSLPEPEVLMMDTDSDGSANIIPVVDTNSNHLSPIKPPLKDLVKNSSSENEEVITNKTPSKKKKQKSRAIQSSDSSSSSSSSEDEETNSKFAPDFFTGIFARTQQKLRSTDDFSELNGCRKKNTNGKDTDKSKTNKGCSSKTTSGRRFGKNRRRIADLPVEEMDTDTELDVDPLEAIQKAAAAEVVSLLDSDSDKDDSNKPTDNVLEEFERFKAELDSSIPKATCPPTEAEDVQFLSQSSYNDSPSKMDLSDIPDRVRIRIKFQAKTYEIDGFMDWDMHQVRKILGERSNIPYRDLLIYNNMDEKMEDGSTLEFYKYEVGDYLDATQRQIVPSASTSNGIKEKQPGDITLAFQKAGTKRIEKHNLNVYKKDTFEEIRREVARALSLDTSKICFKFDGDVLALDETPENLDLEDGDCIDLVIQDS